VAEINVLLGTPSSKLCFTGLALIWAQTPRERKSNLPHAPGGHWLGETLNYLETSAQSAKLPLRVLVPLFPARHVS
jgi:hypothetical protein